MTVEEKQTKSAVITVEYNGRREEVGKEKIDRSKARSIQKRSRRTGES
jgi:hypothetical protein